MSEKFIYGIKDNKVGTFGNPFFSTHEAQAIRECNEVVCDASSMLGKYPEDFDLYSMGRFDDKGEFLDTKPKFIVSFKSLQEKADNDKSKRATPTQNLHELRTTAQNSMPA